MGIQKLTWPLGIFFNIAIGYIYCEQIILDTDTLYPLSLFYIMISRNFLKYFACIMT